MSEMFSCPAQISIMGYSIFNYRSAGYDEHVVPFEQSKGRAPWEVEEIRRATPVTKCPGFWKGLMMQDRQSARGRRDRGNTMVVPDDPHHEPSERLLEAWGPVRKELCNALDSSQFAIWIENLHPHRLIGGVWYLATSPQKQGWVQARFGRLIGACANRPVIIVVCNEMRVA